MVDAWVAQLVHRGGKGAQRGGYDKSDLRSQLYVVLLPWVVPQPPARLLNGLEETSGCIAGDMKEKRG